MASTAKDPVCTIIPILRYRDAVSAIDWLCKAFGFERHAVYPDESGGIAHAQLRFGNGMIMLSSVRDGDWAQRIVQPDEIGGRETQLACVIVADPDAHFQNAIDSGATIVDALADNEHGGRGYSCRDPEGHLWWFGSYDPWRDGN